MSVATAGPSQTPVQARRPEDARKAPRPPLPPPHVLAQLVPDSSAFNELIKLEQKLDWTLLRKKAEINDALGKPVRIKRTLRLFISNTAHDQPWQNALSAPDLETGKGIAGWVLKVEGRLLDSGNSRIDKTRRKFSSFVRMAAIDFDEREVPAFPEGSIVEWHPKETQPPMDGFEISRRGDANVPCRIALHINHYPERFKLAHPLDKLLGMKEATRSEAMSAMWKLIKTVGAQDKEDGSMIRPVGGVEQLLAANSEGLPFYQLPELVQRYLMHPDPVIIPYTVRVDLDYNFSPKCFDIPVEVEDPLKSKMANIVASFEGEEGREIVQLEDKVAELAYFARDLKQKRDFLESFSTDPQAFIQNWLAAQARDLDQMLGYQVGVNSLNGGSVKEEDLRRSDLFNLPWIDEAVTVHEASRMEAERRSR